FVGRAFGTGTYSIAALMRHFFAPLHSQYFVAAKCGCDLAKRVRPPDVVRPSALVSHERRPRKGDAAINQGAAHEVGGAASWFGCEQLMPM
ncbi:hypothetical protein, partial [Salmonella enterica]|uniref:hypothetical protein n=1 Tax=Salmonella enterica TaxID=28901 RepID=UPI00398C4E83